MPEPLASSFMGDASFRFCSGVDALRLSAFAELTLPFLGIRRGQLEAAASLVDLHGTARGTAPQAGAADA